MARRYVCNPKTGRVIEVDGSTYKQVSKNAAYKRKLTRSPKSSSKKKLIPCKSPRRKKKSPKRRRRRAPVKCGNHKGSTAPSSDERNHIAETCGEECFLGDNMRFAVCDTECSHSPLRISAACIRARQLSSPRSKKVKGRSKAYYNRIAQRALALRNAELRSSGGANPRKYQAHNRWDHDPHNTFGTCHRKENCFSESDSKHNMSYSSCKRLGDQEGYGSWEVNDPVPGEVAWQRLNINAEVCTCNCITHEMNEENLRKEKEAHKLLYGDYVELLKRLPSPSMAAAAAAVRKQQKMGAARETLPQEGVRKYFRLNPPGSRKTFPGGT